MILNYLYIPVKYSWLLKTLGTTSEGTPFSNVERLESLRLPIIIRRDGTLKALQSYLDIGLPIIVAVDPLDESDWPGIPHHAVVVTELGETTVFVHDPIQKEAPQTIEQDVFLLAWGNRDYTYIVIGLDELSQG